MSSEVSSRPNPEWILMQSALLWAQRSTCSRAQVGAVITFRGRQVSSGYNGAPAGLPHCDHSKEGVITSLVIDGVPQPMKPDPGCQKAVHAEANAIAFAARHGVALEGSVLYTTHAPCVACAQLMINSGIRKVNYLNDYRITDGRKLLERVGIEVCRVVI
jgi:dCMP deaminase